MQASAALRLRQFVTPCREALVFQLA